MKSHKEAAPLLKVEHLCQYFKSVKAVDDVSFDIKEGEVFGLVGESGCGKTTTGRSIIKIYDITSGNIYFKGKRICAGIQSYQEAIRTGKREAAERIKLLRQEIKEKPEKRAENNAGIAEERRKLKELIAANKEEIRRARKDQGESFDGKGNKLVTKIQMIFQDPIASLNPRMTVKEIISEGLVIKGMKDKQAIDEKVYEILEMVGLVRDHASRYPHEFSGGQRQRIGIARAIIMQPDLLIADEPISALDVSIQAQIINLLNEIRSRLGLTILFIAHDLSVVKYFSDRIGVMYFGKLVELADADELFAHPLHPYTRSLLSAIPLPDPCTEKKRKRILYNNVAEHDYTEDKPVMREITSGHFVYCNREEEERYRKELS
ncbi:MAG: ABC transporter ATP-binding protein [Acetivibrio ethanolgignens]